LEERRLQELAHGRPLLLEWLFISQALLENRPAEARQLLDKMVAAGFSNDAGVISYPPGAYTSAPVHSKICPIQHLLKPGQIRQHPARKSSRRDLPGR
jgi:hypothetical protein